MSWWCPVPLTSPQLQSLYVYTEIGDATGITGSNFNINHELGRWLKCETDYALKWFLEELVIRLLLSYKERALSGPFHSTWLWLVLSSFYFQKLQGSFGELKSSNPQSSCFGLVFGPSKDFQSGPCLKFCLFHLPYTILNIGIFCTYAFHF